MMFFHTLEGDNKIIITDAVMIEINSGNEKSFETLYTHTRHTVYAYILSIVKNTSTAEDIMQETYIKVRTAISSYVPQQKPMAWVITIAKNLCYMHLRSNNNAYNFDIDTQNITNTHDVADSVINKSVLNTALAVLNDKECQIVILKSISGYKLREIAKMLDMPLGTVLSSYNRSMKKLKSKLLEMGWADK